VYALGLFGHAMVGLLSRPFFTGERRTWYPAVAMAAGLAVTVVAAAAAVPVLGVYGIAAGNGIGITTTAVLLFTGLRTRIVAVSVPAVCGSVARLAGAAVVAGGVGRLAGEAMTGRPPLLVAVAGGVVVLTTFAAVARLAGFTEVTAPAAALKRRIRHGR
jgi:putative peptidoglycan lipid II flippase